MDRVSADRRSANMRAVRARDTKPEMIVRRAVHGLGYRYRLHQRRLPGSPDLVFARLKLALFVHGCFWHSHPGCPKASMPTSNAEFWRAKLARNRERDETSMEALETAGWRTDVLWECEIADGPALQQRLLDIFDSAESAQGVVRSGSELHRRSRS